MDWLSFRIWARLFADCRAFVGKHLVRVYYYIDYCVLRNFVRGTTKRTTVYKGGGWVLKLGNQVRVCQSIDFLAVRRVVRCLCPKLVTVWLVRLSLVKSFIWIRGIPCSMVSQLIGLRLLHNLIDMSTYTKCCVHLVLCVGQRGAQKTLVFFKGWKRLLHAQNWLSFLILIQLA